MEGSLEDVTQLNDDLNVIELKTDVSPAKRSQFGLCLSKNDIYIYGGYSNGNVYLDDLWHLNGI